MAGGSLPRLKLIPHICMHHAGARARLLVPRSREPLQQFAARCALAGALIFQRRCATDSVDIDALPLCARTNPTGPGAPGDLILLTLEGAQRWMGNLSEARQIRSLINAHRSWGCTNAIAQR